MNQQRKRYWVVGGEYRNTDFAALVPGTETVAGPFQDSAAARAEWQRLAESTRSTCTVRYSIAEEILR